MAYSEEEIKKVFEKILLDIEKGEPLRQILKKENMPSSQTFFKWLEKDEDKSKLYAHSCGKRADAIFDEIIQIADDATNDFMTITKGDATYNVENKEFVNRSRLRVDARKWIVSKLNPKKYGDKVDYTSNGKEIGTADAVLKILEKLQ